MYFSDRSTFIPVITPQLQTGFWGPVNVRYRQEEVTVDEAFFMQLEEASCLQVLIVMGNLSHPNICSQGICIGDNFLIQVISQLMLITLVDLRLTNKEGLFRNGKVKGSLGCSDPETADFRISREGTKTNSRITMLDLQENRQFDEGSAWKNIIEHGP